MKKLIYILSLVIALPVLSQSKYQFTPIYNITHTPTPNQGKTGTCWSFSTSSFLESEVKRITGKSIDLSEMYSVRKTYPEKAYNYVYRRGKAQFGEGGLSHDVMNIIKRHGVVPQVEYIGFAIEGETKYDHSDMIKELSENLDSIVKNPKKFLTPNWKDEFGELLDAYLGVAPESFNYEGKTYTPQSFAKYLQINPDDYITLTSFTHQPYYSSFILSIPDNFSNGTYYNLPLNEYTQVLENAIASGFTAALDSDVSEKTFSAEHGMAIWPEAGDEKDYFKQVLHEKDITAQERQTAFEDYSTNDDHLMHITGMVKDQIGNRYFDVKNSWGIENKAHNGHIYMSIPYFKLKSIAYTIHKDAIPKKIKDKLGIK